MDNKLCPLKNTKFCICATYSEKGILHWICIWTESFVFWRLTKQTRLRSPFLRSAPGTSVSTCHWGGRGQMVPPAPSQRRSGHFRAARGTCVYVSVCVWACMCMHVCMWVFVCVHVCVYVWVCMCVHMYAVSVCVYVCVSMSVCMHVWVWVYVCVHVCVYVWVCMCVHMCAVSVCVYVCVGMSVCMHVWVCTYVVRVCVCAATFKACFPTYYHQFLLLVAKCTHFNIENNAGWVPWPSLLCSTAPKADPACPLLNKTASFFMFQACKEY